MNSKIINTNKEYAYFLDAWLKHKLLSVKTSTYTRYKSLVEKHIKPELGKIKINEIDTIIIEEFILKKQLNNNNRLSAKTISDIIVIIKNSLKYIQSTGIAITFDYSRISVKKEYYEMKILNVEEEKRLLSVLMKNQDRYKVGVIICLYTGIRIGELCALRWENISLKNKTVTVKTTMQRIQKIFPDSYPKTQIIITQPKSSCSLRIIPLPDFLINIIAPFKAENESFILSGEKEKFVEPRTMQNHFKKYLKEADIENKNFHCLRHTFATRCVETEFDIKSLSEILGHSNVNITLNKYVHSSVEFKRKNMKKLDYHFNNLL